MSKQILIALRNPVEGKEQEFNDSYDNQHIPDVLALPGCLSAQRFKLSVDQIPGWPPPHRYLAIYEFESETLALTVKTFLERAGTPAPRRIDGVARDTTFLTAFFEPLGPKIEKTRPE